MKKNKIIGKSFLSAAVAILLAMMFLCACSSPEKETETETTEVKSFVADFYKTYDESRTLSVELPSDPSSGYYWTYEITDEEILNLTSFMFNPGDESGDGALWTSTFAAPGNKGGNVKLYLYYIKELEDVKNSQPKYEMDIDLSVDGKITVKSIKQ